MTFSALKCAVEMLIDLSLSHARLRISKNMSLNSMNEWSNIHPSSTMSTPSLPPLRNLPSWTRVRDLDRVRYPRLLSSDCMVRSPPVDTKSPKAAAQPRTDAHSTRIASLEKDILFLQQQHKDTLERLHAEIEDLKRVNKGVLHYSSS